MSLVSFIYWPLALLCCVSMQTASAYPLRLTFELPDNEMICFYEHLKSHTKYNFGYQVIHGGQQDVDIEIKGPTGEIIRTVERGSDDDFVIEISSNGTCSFCFGNEFSSITHKLVYFELHPENYETLAEEAGLPNANEPTAMTLIESIIEVLHRFLSYADSVNTELKNNDLGDYLVAEDLNSAVLMWSLIVTVVVILTTLGQVTVLKSFFNDKKMAYSRHTPGFPT